MVRCTSRTIVLAVLFAVAMFPAAAQDVPLMRQPPAHDNFLQPAGLTDSSTVITEIIETTVEANEPNHPCAGAARTNSVWFSFHVPAGEITLSTHNSTGSAVDTIMTIWTGDFITNLTAVECDTNDGVDEMSYIKRTLAAGMYRLQVSRDSVLPAAVVGTLHVNMSFDPSGTIPVNDSKAGAITLGMPGSSIVTGLDNASRSSDDPSNSCIGRQPSHSVWYSITVPSTANATIMTSNSDADTVLGLYTSSGDIYTMVNCNDDLGGGSRLSRMNSVLVPGTVYYIVLGSFHDNGYLAASTAEINVAYRLLDEGSFELNPLSWTVAKDTGEKVKCGNDVTAFGDCAFLFKGGAGEASKLSRSVTLPAGYTPNVSHAIGVSYFTRGKSTTTLKLTLKFKYDGGSTVKCKLAKTTDGGVGSWAVNSTVCSASVVSLNSVKAQFKHTSTKAKVFLDDIEVWLQAVIVPTRDTPAALGVLPPPAAPDGFRGGN